MNSINYHFEVHSRFRQQMQQMDKRKALLRRVVRSDEFVNERICEQQGAGAML